MLSNRVLSAAVRSARPAIRLQSHIPRASFNTMRSLRAMPDGPLPEEVDPGMNGGYINPPKEKRINRDPYEDWDDKQERRNFGEPVHEDNDILGVFSLHDYNHMTPAQATLCWGVFISAVLAIFYSVKATYPDRPSAPKEYEGGLDKELGGAGSLRARQGGDEFK